MQKPRLFNVYFFLKRKCFLFFFFQKFFLFKISYFCQKKSYDLKNHTQGTSGGTLKICRRNLKKNQFLLIFDDFVKNFIFDQIFGFVGNIVGVIKSWETDKLKKKIFFQVEKFMENMSDILKYASECQIDAIFVIKSDWLLNTKSQSILSND